jgi:hypothetical protein
MNDQRSAVTVAEPGLLHDLLCNAAAAVEEVKRLRAENAELRTEYAIEHGHNGHLAQRLFERAAEVERLRERLVITDEKVEAALGGLWGEEDYLWQKKHTFFNQPVREYMRAALLAAGMEEPCSP